MEKTLAIIKPDAVKDKNVGAIISKIEKAGFAIKFLKVVKLRKHSAGSFYMEHKGKDFYNDLVNFMRSGDIIVLSLEKENAIKDFRELMGATNLFDRKLGTIRYEFGLSNMHNAIHGSDSVESSKKEHRFFYEYDDIFGGLN